MGADKMAKNGQKCWSQPGFEPGAFQREKKVRIFCLKLYHWATEADTWYGDNVLLYKINIAILLIKSKTKVI